MLKSPKAISAKLWYLLKDIDNGGGEQRCALQKAGIKSSGTFAPSDSYFVAAGIHLSLVTKCHESRDMYR